MWNSKSYLLILLMLILACSKKKEQVIIYCSLDKMYSEPLLLDFEKQSGIKVKAVYDTELTKTVGLVNRIIAESNNPQCDVFWNNEISRTIHLEKSNLLEPYLSVNAHTIPQKYKSEQGFWTGFAARARVIIYNREKCSDDNLPSSFFDLANNEWKGKAALAYPLFGTTATHAAAIYELYGDNKAKSIFNQINDNGTAILDGNATVRDRVVSGEYWWGFTDTDDANGAIEDGKNVGIIYPDQIESEVGMMIIPNTVALIKESQNQENGKRLIDFILSKQVEENLAQSRAAQIPLHIGVPLPDKVVDLNKIKIMEIDYFKVCDKLESSSADLQRIFVK